MVKNLILIVGPTAVGKTALSIELAKKFGGEIISADSMQIYKDMDIGTAKIRPEDMDGIAHYMIDEVSPNEEFSVSDFKQKAYEYIDKIYESGKLPMIVGGTGLYVNSIVYKLDFADANSNPSIREKYLGYAEEFGNDYIYQKLMEVDPDTAQRLNLNDKKRVVRALEVYEVTGEPMSKTYGNFREENNDFNLIYIGLTMDRTLLYNRINRRVDMMLEAGLVEEVESLLSNGCKRDSMAMKAIGYKEVLDYIDGNTSYDDMVEVLKRNSRRFAKRQLTWFKRDSRIKWFEVDKYEEGSLTEDIGKICSEMLTEGGNDLDDRGNAGIIGN